MEGLQRSEFPVFNSPEEELRYLRERVREKEQSAWKEQTPIKKEEAISQTLHEYAKDIPQSPMEHLVNDPAYEKVVGFIHTPEHREKMRGFFDILREKGVAGAVQYTRALDNPHFEDDFHRVLVGYVKTGAVVPGLEKEKELDRLLRTTVYHVSLPFSQGEDASGSGTIAQMERLYVGLLATLGGSSALSFSVEISVENFSYDIAFYVAVPDQLKDVFLKQVFGIFPTATVQEDKGDYNIFNEFGAVSAGYAAATENFAFPINLFEQAEHDPLKVILNAFSKIERDGEGAAVQFIIYPDQYNLIGKYKHAISRMRQGVSAKEALDIPLGIGADVIKSIGSLFGSSSKTGGTQDAAKAAERDRAVGLVEEKIRQSVALANIRIVTSAATQARADEIYTAIESSFYQYTRPQANGLKFNRVDRSKLEQFIYRFTYRVKDDRELAILNLRELATLCHFPQSVAQHEAPQLAAVKSQGAPAPSEVPKEGVLLGVNKYRGEGKEIRFAPLDRVRHLYTIGQTGTGKSVFLKNLAIQDIKAGHGVCFIDPHGSDVQDILANIPKERINDVIYFDPSETSRPFGLNMLEYDPMHPEQKIFVVNELLSIFKKLYASTPEAMGPAFEQYFRNATMLVLEDPETGNTLLEISRVLADANFRNLKISRCKNPIVVQFWRDIATKTSGESGLANMIPYITNKFDVFLSNDVMRPIIAQEESSFNFRNVMDTEKILLVNLAKGKLGDINANLIGLILVGKILMAAMSRVDSFGTKLPDFYLYIDEFQNITTDSISAILSEARKYGLSLNVAHQFIAQLDPSIRDAVFGNVGSMAVFRVGSDDAQELASQFAPIFTPEDIMKIDNYNCYMRMLMNGKPVAPFNIATPPAPKGNPEIIPQLKQLSALRFGRDRKVVDDAIMKKYLSVSQQASAPQGGAAIPTRAPASPQVASVQVPQAVRPAPIPPNITPSTLPTGGTPSLGTPIPSKPAQVPVPQIQQSQQPQRTPFAQAMLRASLSQQDFQGPTGS